MSIRQEAFRGVLWSGGANLFSTLLSFLSIAILAHFLSPAEFGLMGMFLVLFNLVGMINDLGIGTAAIQAQGLSRSQISTLFYLNILGGIVLSLITYLLANPVALFFQQPKLVSLVEIGSIVFLFVGTSSTFRILLQKEMKFKHLGSVEIFGAFVYGIVAIFLSMGNYGVLSLLVGFLARQLVELIALWSLVRYRPVPVIRFQELREMIRFGLYVLGERILNYCNRNLDYILIGRFLGSEALGYYSLAYQLMFAATTRVSQIVSKVSYPAFSKVQLDNEKIRKGYLEIIRYIGLVVFPLITVLGILAPEFVVTVYGSQWLPSVVILQVFCVLGVVESVGSTVGGVIYAKGRAEIAFRYNIVNVVVTGMAIVIGLSWGIIGVAISLSVFSFPLAYLWHSKTNALIDLPWRSFLQGITAPLISAILLFVAAGVLKLGLTKVFLVQSGAVIIVAVGIFAGAFCLVVLAIRESAFFSELKQFFSTMRWVE